MAGWRVVGKEVHNAYLNMALDEAVSEAVRDGKSPPTLRFYKWKPSAVSIGYFQGLEEEVDTGLCKDWGVDFVRRRTGGGAVYHDFNGEITYSIIAPESLFPKDIIASYREICGWIIAGLKKAGIESEFKPINDIIAGGKKISGNAQTRRQGVLLQHGTVLYGLDVETMFRLLKVPKEKISDKMIADVKQRVTCVKDLNGASEEEVYQALYAGFTEGKQFQAGTWTQGEMARAKELAETKYAAKEWNSLR